MAHPEVQARREHRLRVLEREVQPRHVGLRSFEVAERWFQVPALRIGSGDRRTAIAEQREYRIVSSLG